MFGVENNGQDLGTVVFNVPYKTSQSFYYNLAQINNVDLITDLKFDQINNRSVSEFVAEFGGIDGITNKIHPGDAMDKDLYDLPPEEEKQLKLVAFSLDEALEALDGDRDFLKAGDVFSDDLIDAYMDLLNENATRLRMATHPVEFDMYYSL